MIWVHILTILHTCSLLYLIRYILASHLLVHKLHVMMHESKPIKFLDKEAFFAESIQDDILAFPRIKNQARHFQQFSCAIPSVSRNISSG